MICYQLRCGAGHHFEGWFRSSDDFDRQARTGLVDCPSCGSVTVERALMAPSIIGGAKRPPAAEQAKLAVDGEVIPPARSMGGDMPAALRALLGRMREQIERTCDDVGHDFADQALRMHHGEVEKRGIYGETTEAQREILAEEGVEIASIPWIKGADS
jgi:hypothetical protein